MYDDQIKFLKAVNPRSLFTEESVNLAFSPHARVVNSLRNSYWRVFIFFNFSSGKSLVVPTRVTSKTRKLIGHRVTVSSSKLDQGVACVTDPMTYPSLSRFF